MARFEAFTRNRDAGPLAGTGKGQRGCPQKRQPLEHDGLEALAPPLDACCEGKRNNLNEQGGTLSGSECFVLAFQPYGQRRHDSRKE